MKVTATADIRIYANVVGRQRVVIRGSAGFKPTNSKQWVFMHAGETRDDISLIIGLDPHLFPEMGTECVGRNLWVVPYHGQEDFQDLLLVE